MPTYEDLVGKKFSRLTVIKRMPNDKNYNTMFLCKCDCGNETTVCASSLKEGHTKSCGCLNKVNNSHPLDVGVANMHNVIISYRNNAKTRGLDWRLTEQQFKEITKKPCHYCGALPNNKTNRRDCNGVYVYNGIDRVDNEKGYIINNVVPCCKRCNNAKRNFGLEDFKDWIRKIYNKFERGE